MVHILKIIRSISEDFENSNKVEILNVIKVKEGYIVLMCGRSSSFNQVSEYTKKSFTRKTRIIDNMT